MKLSFKAFISLMLTVPVNIACSKISYEKKLESLYEGTVPTIQSSDLKRLVERGDDRLIILDIRSPEEYQVSRIPGAKFINYESFGKEDVKGVPKNAEIVVYCSVGYRSERIGKKMLDMGFENVRNLYGGIFQWKNEDNEVINQHQSVTDSVHTYNKKWSKWLEKGIKVH
jgi:rhodanese-related sulfurtransferase